MGASSGPWKGIINVIRQLHGRGVDLCELCPIRVGNGMQTDFRRDIWLETQPLSVQFPRIFALDDCQVVSVANRLRFGWQYSALRRELRGGVESEQWLAISDLIRNFSFSHRPGRFG